MTEDFAAVYNENVRAGFSGGKIAVQCAAHIKKYEKKTLRAFVAVIFRQIRANSPRADCALGTTLLDDKLRFYPLGFGERSGAVKNPAGKNK